MFFEIDEIRKLVTKTGKYIPVVDLNLITLTKLETVICHRETATQCNHPFHLTCQFQAQLG